MDFNFLMAKLWLMLCFLMLFSVVAVMSEAVVLGINDIGLMNEGVRKDGNDVDVDKTGDSVVDEEEERMILHQLDPVEIGYVRNVEVSPGRTVQMKTVATKPPVFEIFNLLTPEECDHMIELGEKKGLQISKTITGSFMKKYGLYADDGITLVYNVSEWNQTFNEFDSNLDGFIDYKELHRCLPVLKDRHVELTLAQVVKLMVDLDLDSDSNGLLNLNEFYAMMTRSLDDLVTQWLEKLEINEIKTEEKVRGRDRVSDQTWLFFLTSDDQLLKELPYRIATLTGLHSDIVRSSESIQVARYYPGGYYHAHYDSSPIDPSTSCIQSMMTLENVSHLHPKGRICRFITIMTYLTDVDEGGETAFPYADNDTYSSEVAREQDWRVTDLKNHCHDANLVIHPAKGKTVMWYNHHIDPETGWLGNPNNYSLHGGCEVTRGVKWIANNWIAVDDIYSRQMKFHKKYFEKHTPSSKSTQAMATDEVLRTGEEPLTSTSADDINAATSSDPSIVASEKTEGQREGAFQDRKLTDAPVDESHDTSIRSDGVKGEL
ncbi:transmembrane prolyl 4-hydroxylase-like [Lytechinus variegatus]|uniref:transmembrane prolyl 4-hydroxylase-like n=1 Tax=Lytechinus variegatus TaxID=7654 RepID=UPI001BB10477|nr:transmembrane prolyl 4-hydroxylase-like [Lytechinus variegatus]